MFTATTFTMKHIDGHNFEELLIRIGEGDQQAFAIIYDFYAADLIRHISKKISNPQTAEDILHDLFLSLWNNRAKIVEIVSLPAYLYSSCRYLMLAHFRQQLKQGNQEDIRDVDLLDDSLPLEDQLYYRYMLDTVANEVENLPEKCREVFKLSREEFLSNKEIAAKLNISESTVEKHINKAIKRLRAVTSHLFHVFLIF